MLDILPDINEDISDLTNEINFEKSDDTKEEKLLQCYHCSEMFIENSMKDHMRSSHGRFSSHMFGEKRPYQCSKCNFALLNNPSQDKHVCKTLKTPKKSKGTNNAKSAKEPIRCQICDRDFERQAILNNHMATAHSEERNFPCNYCDFKAKISIVLKRHVQRKHHNELNFICELCGKKFFEAYRLRLHEKSHAKQQNKIEKNLNSKLQEMACDICNRSFLGHQALNVHKSVSHGIVGSDLDLQKKAFTCDKCGKNFATPKCLTDHGHQEHPSTEKVSSVECKCDSCHLTFDNALDLNNHLFTCSKDLKNFTCPKCQLTNWYAATSLRKHIAESHGMIFTVCDICGSCLKSKYYLEDHKKSVHQGLKNFSCSYCGKVFASKSTLNGHVGRMHETIARKFKCDKCDFSCLEPNKLKIHEGAVHAKSVKYQCQLCKYFSYRKTGLQNHIKVVHEKYRPHKCELCDLSFTYKRDKLKHMSKHTNDLNLN